MTLIKRYVKTILNNTDSVERCTQMSIKQIRFFEEKSLQTTIYYDYIFLFFPCIDTLCLI